MNYNDLLDFLNYYKQKNKDINPGTVLGQLINNVVDKDTGAIPYFYLNENGKIKIAKNDGKNFQPTQEMQQGHAQILENLKGEDSETWMNRLVGALGGERQFSAIDDWNTNHLDALRDWNLNGGPANMESTTNDLKDGTQTNTEQTVNETAEQYNTEQEPINNEKPPQEEVKKESGPQMEVDSPSGATTILEEEDYEGIPGGIDFDSYGDNTFVPPEDTNMPTTSEEMIEYAQKQREKNLQKPQYNQNSEPNYYSNAQADQDKIENIWENLDPNMSIDDFMDQFDGVDGVTKKDIDRQKLINRAKQNKNSGMEEQENIDDIWNYIKENNMDVSIEDVENAFSNITKPVNVDQENIDKIWNNLDPNMSVEDFMDQFAGIDGVSQRDIDVQKVKNRIKQNNKEGMSEQESISDIWDYISNNKLDVGTEDLSDIFQNDMGIEKYIPPKPKDPTPKFENETLDIVNNNFKNKQKQKNKNKTKKKDDGKTKQKTLTQQIQETYGEIKQVLAKNRRAKSKKAYDLIRRGKYEEINVRTTMGRVQVVRNRRNGEIVQRTFISSGKDKIEYQMGHGKRGRIDYEVYRDADSGILNYLRHYRDKLGPIPRRETGNHIPTAVENPVTGEKTVTKKAEEAFAEAGEIVKNIKGDKWTEMDAETFNFDVEKERDKFRNPEDGEWVPEKYTKEEREFLENREQKFKDDLDLAEEEWQGFKENNKGLERKIKNKINKLENQLEDPKLSTAEKDKIRSKLADYQDRLDNFQSQKKALKDRRKKARQDWNNRNTEGKINQELKGITETVEGVDLDKFYEQYEKLKNIDINKLTGKEKYKYESQLKRAEILKKKIEETSLKEASLEKLKRNVLKSKRSIENMSPGQFVKEVGFSGVMSGITAVGTYKDNRREGRSVLSSAVRAGADFVLAETLGPGAYMALNLVKEAPDLAVKGASALFKETRRLNSSARFATFGEANFQDTQQLATMRQSGMELAKMSQYRLEQTLMGNEAKYLHR